MRCPRRDEIGAVQLGSEDHWGKDNTCSYCGSLNPDTFLEMAKRKVTLGPTDKNYKVYTSEGPMAGRGKFYFQHLSDEQKQEFVNLFNAKELNLGYPGYFYTVPFFMKLAD